MNRLLTMLYCLGVLALLPWRTGAAPVDTEAQSIDYQVLTSGLDHPWSLAFLPDGRLLVSERVGRLRLVAADGTLDPRPIAGLPPIHQYGQGGLLDVILHPDFEHNRRVYFSFAERGPRGYGTSVAFGELDVHHLNNVRVIYSQLPRSSKTYHFGSRLVFDRQGHLFITQGDRGGRMRAQDLGDLAGKLLRINDDGSIPRDNPFVGVPGARPEIWSYGHRNMQGAALHPLSGRVWVHEHGPQGGDELNIPLPGRNYGWPIITYGAEYGSGLPIGEGSRKAGMEQPIHYWVPSIAPSGMAFYTANRFPAWRGDLFIGSLKFRLLVRLRLDGERVLHEERLLADELGRIRDVRQGPDGLIYLLTDEDNGKLVRLVPAE